MYKNDVFNEELQCKNDKFDIEWWCNMSGVIMSIFH